VNSATGFIHRLLIIVGNFLTIIGCALLILLASGVVPGDAFFAGISLGVRAVGSVAIAGCLLSAIGYAIVDYLDE